MDWFLKVPFRIMRGSELWLVMVALFIYAGAFLWLRKREHIRLGGHVALGLWALYTSLLIVVTIVGRSYVEDPTGYFFQGWSFTYPSGRKNPDPFYNLLMFIPWTFFASMAFPMVRNIGGILQLTLSGFLFSVTIEITQLVTARGACQLADIVYNTLSALIGALLFIPFAYLLNKYGKSVKEPEREETLKEEDTTEVS